MKLNKKDIDVLKTLIKQEIKEVKNGDPKIFRPGVVLLSAKEKYEDYLEELLKKLE